jgi:hypothetical protein
LMHNLGGVQDSSPNTSHGFHCIDEWDIMCYSDGPNYPTMHYVCQPQAMDHTELDCRHDDYYNANPSTGSYLARCWNPANNQFLIGAMAPPSTAPECQAAPPSDFTSPTVSIVVPSSVGPGRGVSIEANASDDASVAAVAFGVCSGTTCDWNGAQPLGQVSGPPYTVAWHAPKRGTFTFLAQATDSSGNAALSAPATMQVKIQHKAKKKKHGQNHGKRKQKH